MIHTDAAGQCFVADLLASLPPAAIPAARAVLNRHAGGTIYLPHTIRREEQAQFVAALLAGGLEPALIVGRVSARYGCSKRTAWRWVTKSRVICRGKLAEFAASPQESLTHD